MSQTGLVVGLGNPILTDDAVGLFITAKLEELYRERAAGQAEWRFLTFDGNPLDLVSYLTGIDRLLVIDSLYPNDGGPVSLQRLTGSAAQKKSRAAFATDSHGFGIIDMLNLAYRLEVATVDEAWLLLIPVDDPYILGEQLTAETELTAEAVTEYAWYRWFEPAAQKPGGSTYA